MGQSEKIAEQIPLKTNRWTVFNAFTHFTSHNDITHKTRDRVAEQAEKAVLTNERFAPIVVKQVA